MTPTTSAEYEIALSPCGNTLWVNANDGSYIARFSKKFGIDIHNSATKQMETGIQCLYCTHTEATAVDWNNFRQKVKQYHDIELPLDLIKFKPVYISLEK